MSFSPFADLKDKNNSTYNYWSDGSIRNVAENEVNAISAVIIKRDYTAETDLQALRADGVAYSLYTITLPVTAGVTFRISPSLSLNAGASYYFTRTDWLDNISHEGKGGRKGNGANDGFLYSFVGLNYNFGKNSGRENTDPTYEKVDFVALEKSDSDKDGVPDAKDRCSGTASNSKVDLKGCPFDDDLDGVPNELDKEPKTKKDAQVDVEGKTLSKKESTAKLSAGARTTPVESKTPNSSGTMPQEFRWVDQNKDGKISQKEIGSAIDRFFDDDPESSLSSVMKVIDYFFDQE